MIKKILTIFVATTSLVTACLAQPNDSQITNNSGLSIQGVQLSISLSNNIISVGAEFAITAEIKNSSTNLIYLGESSPETDFSVFLTSDSGKVYKLTPPDVLSTRTLSIDLKPGESRDWIIHVGVNKYFEPPRLSAIYKNIEQGSYILKATRRFIVKNNTFELESNLLKVQVQ